MKRRIYQVLVIIISLFLIQGLSKSLVELSAQRNRVLSAEKELTDLQKEKDKLAADLSYFQSDTFVESVARDKLSYGKDGETMLILSPDIKDRIDHLVALSMEQDRNKVVETLPNWKKWLRALGVGI